MKTKINFWLFAFTAVIILSITSCKKELSSTPAEETPAEIAASTEVVTDEAIAEEQFDDVFNITASISAEDAGEEIGMGTNVSGLAEAGSTLSPTSPRCFTVTVVPRQPGVFPKTVTIDFGNGCLGRDGKYRKGKIVTIYTNRMLIPGAKISTTFIGYHVDSFHIEGTHITANTSTSNMQGWEVKVIDGKITNTNNSRWRKWNSTKNVLQTEGNGTSNFPLDDVYKITGNGNGSNSAGHYWYTLVTKPLIKKFTCRWISEGKIQLTRNNRQVFLDYGDGRCDRLAVLYINGVGYTIIL